MEPQPLSTDEACNTKSKQQPFDATTKQLLLLLDADNDAATSLLCAKHNDDGSPKNAVPFLKSNYKYKRRVSAAVAARVVNYSVTGAEQLEAKRSTRYRPRKSPLSEVIAVGLIASAFVVFRDILLDLLRRVFARESRVWCINSNKIKRAVSEMSAEVKRFASARIGDRLRRRFDGSGGAATVTPAIGRTKSFGLECVGASLRLICLTLFIALWMTVYEVEAGTCWMERMDNGKCKNLYASNTTKAQCCGRNQMFSYSDKNLSNVEHFFILAMGGENECLPCLESCKNVVCGPNKRCVKRKGRPKCICSPKCGSGKKHKKVHRRKQQYHHQLQHHQQQQHIHQQNGSLKPPHVIDVSRSKEHVSLVNFHSPITVRDVRSLSSEIHNNPSAVSAMVLTSPGDPISQSNSRRKNQRISTNPTKKQVASAQQQQQQHRLHHHHHRQQEQQHHQRKQQQEEDGTAVTRRRHASADRNKGDKLIITADDLVRPSTERDNDLAESNSLRDQNTSSTDSHPPNQRQQHGGRHHFKKHAKPKRKIADQNRAAHNSVHNGTTAKSTATTMTTTATAAAVAAAAAAAASAAAAAVAMANRNEMKIAERRQHRTQSFDVFPASFASSSSSSSVELGFKNTNSNTNPIPKQKQKPTQLHQSANNNHKELHLGQDYADDLTFDDKIHNGFFSNGFPYPHQELSADEGRYSHPVCGSDGRTYNTECQLKKRACRTDNTALVVAYRGHCQTSCKKVNCLNGLQCVEDHYAIPHCIVCAIECPIDDAAQRIDPARAVCGVDGNTYRSTCDINRMVCKIGRSIAVAYPGPCRDDRSSCSNVSCGPKMTCLTDLLTHRPRCVSCKFKCSRKRRPASLRYEEGKICGSNNRTYYSWCEMKKDSCQTGFYIDIKSIGECQ